MCGVPHHPPLTLTPLGPAMQDFRLASNTLFSPVECNLGEKWTGILDRTMSLRLMRNYGVVRVSRAVLLFNYSRNNKRMVLQQYLLEEDMEKYT